VPNRAQRRLLRPWKNQAEVHALVGRGGGSKTAGRRGKSTLIKSPSHGAHLPFPGSVEIRRARFQILPAQQLIPASNPALLLASRDLPAAGPHLPDLRRSEKKHRRCGVGRRGGLGGTPCEAAGSGKSRVLPRVRWRRGRRRDCPMRGFAGKLTDCARQQLVEIAEARARTRRS